MTRALRWAYQQQIKGFESDDVLVTADFFEMQDKLFDIFNSRGLWNRGFKRALVPGKTEEAEKIFAQAWNVYTTLQTPSGTGLVESKRKTGK